MVSTAFIAINCELGSTNEIITEIRKVSGVDEVKEVGGLYDIIMRISADNPDKLKETITKQIRTTAKILSTLTLITTNKEQMAIQWKWKN